MKWVNDDILCNWLKFIFCIACSYWSILSIYRYIAYLSEHLNMYLHIFLQIFANGTKLLIPYEQFHQYYGYKIGLDVLGNESTFACMPSYKMVYNFTFKFGMFIKRAVFRTTCAHSKLEWNWLILDASDCIIQPQIYSETSDLSIEGTGLVLNCSIYKFGDWRIANWVLPNRYIAQMVWIENDNSH